MSLISGQRLLQKIENRINERSRRYLSEGEAENVEGWCKACETRMRGGVWRWRRRGFGFRWRFLGGAGDG